MIVLQHFKENEFHHPELMNEDALRFFDAARHISKVSWTLTSDARTPEQNAKASGSSPTSLHLVGRAIDFVPADGWTKESIWKIVDGIMQAYYGQRNGVELELVHGPDDKHVHLGLFPDNRPPRLELTID